MANEWWLPRELWYAMTPEAQRLHSINVRAYFLSQQREKDGVPGSPESDWAAAEWEEDRHIESYGFYCKSKDAKDRNEKIRYTVLYGISSKLLMRAADITDETPLPTDKEKRQQLGQSVGWDVINDPFQIPDEVTTVGALIEILKKTPPVVRRRAVNW